MNSNLIEHFLNKKQITITDFSLIHNVNYDNVVETFNYIFKFDWTYEILKIKEISPMNEICIVIAVYIPGRVITSMVSDGTSSELSELLNKALINALIDCSSSITKDTNENKITISANDIDKLEDSIKNETPKNEYGIRQDQISFMNDFKLKYTIDSDEKFNHYIQTWSDNNIYEINTKKELILAGEKVVDEFINWISIASANDAMINPIVSPI